MTKRNKVKILVTVVLILSMIGCLGVQAYAVTPRWVGIYNIDLDIAFNNGKGTVAAASTKHDTAELIEGTLYLYRLEDDDWVYMGEWYNSKAIGTLGLSGTFVCESGVTYKGVFTVTAYTNGVPETQTVEYSKTCP